MLSDSERMRVSIGIGYGDLLYSETLEGYFGEEMNYASKLGEDLAGVVHEWGGSPEGVLPIVNRFWMDSEGTRDRLFMMIPDTEADFLAYFRFVRSNGAKGILAHGVNGRDGEEVRLGVARRPEADPLVFQPLVLLLGDAGEHPVESAQVVEEQRPVGIDLLQ